MRVTMVQLQPRPSNQKGKIKMKSWFDIQAKNGRAEIVIFDEIGTGGISAKAFNDQLKALGDVQSITLRINSPGGDVFDGTAIYNMLKRHPARVEVTVDGIAASIASVIAMAGDRIIMPENSMLMIHNPWGGVIGEADDMRDMAEALEKIKVSILSAYRRSGKSDEKISALMDAETWLSAQEAVAAGFADEMIPAVKVAALFDLSKFANPPRIVPQAVDVEQIRAQARTEAMEELKQIYSLCAKAGVADMAEGFIAKGHSVEWVRGRLQHADAIRSRCAAAGMAHRAEKFIRADATPQEVSENLLELKVALAAPEIDNKVPTFEQKGWEKPQEEAPIETAQIYLKRRQRPGDDIKARTRAAIDKALS
jgi:ATP-dependent Clp protease, protease subunit